MTLGVFPKIAVSFWLWKAFKLPSVHRRRSFGLHLQESYTISTENIPSVLKDSI